MTVLGLLRKWLVETPITGRQALICAIAAVALPTLLRASLGGIVEGVGFTPYFPFVLLAALQLSWRQAALVAAASAAVGDALFVGSPYQVMEGATDVFGVVVFFAGAALIIGLVHAIRTAFADVVGPTAAGGVIFSLRNGQAWASWPGAGYHLRLGARDDVVEMMKDFIAQVEVGKRLTGETQADNQEVMSA